MHSFAEIVQRFTVHTEVTAMFRNRHWTFAMPSTCTSRCCAIVISALVYHAVLSTFEFADAKKHGRRSAEYHNKRDIADPLNNRRLRKPDQNDKDIRKSSVPENYHRISRIIAITEKGTFRGRLQDVMDMKVATFLGMRYGEAPAGKLRFKKPVPAKKRNGIQNAVNYPNTCYQWRDNTFGEGYPGTEMWNPNTPVSEDCLFLNVWSPLSSDFSGKNMPTNQDLLPVMLWIYGGGFYSGTSSLDVYDGTWLAATQEVVVVSVNYRIAAMGFLTFGTEDAPGNAGLWDQNLALRWVRENIRHFGGDPSRITLFGESAGAASINMHILSSHSNKLFQNAILQSASILSPWAVLPMDLMKNRANTLAGKLGCRVESNDTAQTESEMMACMYDTDAQIIANVEIGMEDLGTARFQNAAVLDEDFLTSEVFEQLKSGNFVTNISILAGFNRNEGNYFLTYSTEGFKNSNSGPITYSQFRKGLAKGLWGYHGQPTNAFEAATNHPSNLMLDAIDFEYTNFQEILKDREKCARQHICANTDSKNDYKSILDHIVGDMNFVCPVVHFLKKSNQPNVTDCTCDGSADDSSEEPKEAPKKFLYKFLHRSSQTPWPEWMGTLHGYEIEFVMGIPLNRSFNYTDEERELSKLMMKYWSNFAKSGDPNYGMKKSSDDRALQKTELWPVYEEEKAASLVFSIEPINNDKPTSVTYIQENKETKHCSFWNDYYPILLNSLKKIESKACIKTNESRSSAESSKSTSSVLVCCSVLISFGFTHLQYYS